jgi:hypothetical protein
VHDANKAEGGPLGHLMMYAHTAAIIVRSLVVLQSIVESQLNCVVSVDMMSWCRRSREEGALSFAAARAGLLFQNIYVSTYVDDIEALLA